MDANTYDSSKALAPQTRRAVVGYLLGLASRAARFQLDVAAKDSVFRAYHFAACALVHLLRSSASAGGHTRLRASLHAVVCGRKIFGVFNSLNDLAAARDIWRTHF
eukprot:TRINITY_DN2624_c0_g1_i1.p4 TRINITY_DN2624_c0_g1~~TRINITY_DN2624_c0_g1_i1.p4  ORF type:complete len:124 (-),score=46.93 TRINITY_DN2624_c0_g1_i1:615-932(-)